jgi:hypothetical protein
MQSVISHLGRHEGYVPTSWTEDLAKGFRSHTHDFSTATPLAAEIQLDLALKVNDIAWYLIHEASHKYALTTDVGPSEDQRAYYDGQDRRKSVKSFHDLAVAMVQVRRGGVGTPLGAAAQEEVEREFLALARQDKRLRVIFDSSMDKLLDNADSYSHFTCYLPAQVLN